MIRTRLNAYIFPVSVCFAICALLFFLLDTAWTRYDRAHNSPAIYVNCFTRSESGIRIPDYLCLKETTDRLLKTYSTASLMTYIKSATSDKVITDYCHDIAHTIGTRTYARSGSVEDALSKCTYACGSGCVHGVVAAAATNDLGAQEANADDIAHADIETIKEIGAKYCATGPSLCHGIGHVLFVNSQNFQKSLVACDAISGNFPIHCYDGVFMEGSGLGESFLPLLSTTSPRAVETPDTYANSCHNIAIPYQRSCFRYLFLYRIGKYLEAGVRDIPRETQETRAVCDTFTGTSRSYCYEGFGFRYARYETVRDDNPGPTLNLATLCDQLPDKIARDSCILGVVYRLHLDDPQAKKQLVYCTSISSADEKSLCYRIAFQNFGKPFTSGAAGRLCNAAAHVSECLAQFNDYQTMRTSFPDYSYGLFGKTPAPTKK